MQDKEKTTPDLVRREWFRKLKRRCLILGIAVSILAISTRKQADASTQCVSGVPIVISVLISLCLTAGLLRIYEIRMRERLIALYKLIESLSEQLGETGHTEFK